jgi:hypothetical protein
MSDSTLPLQVRLSRSVLGLCGLLAVSGCSSDLTNTTLETFSGEWCTFQALTSQDLPAPGKVWVGLAVVEQGGEIFGTGSIRAPNETEIIPSRYFGTVTGLTAVIDRTNIPDAEVAGPALTLTLTRDGDRDLRGTISGDAAFNGPIHLVRLGPRCFVP